MVLAQMDGSLNSCEIHQVDDRNLILVSIAGLDLMDLKDLNYCLAVVIERLEGRA